MAQSQNTKVELSIPASMLSGLTTQGTVMLGDKAFEYYNERNVEDYIQIPWNEIDYVSASVIFKKHIPRFAIFTKKNGHYIFSTRNNKQTLRVMRTHLENDQLLRSLSAFDVVKRGIEGIFHKS